MNLELSSDAIERYVQSSPKMCDGLHNHFTLLKMILLIQSSKAFTVKPTPITSPAPRFRDSHDVTSAMFESLTSPVGVELYSYVNAFFCRKKFS